MTSFFEQFAVELNGVNERTCNGECTYDANEQYDVTDHESC